MASKGKVLQTVISIAGEVSPSLGKTLKGVTDKLDGVNVKALAVGAAFGGMTVAAGKAVLEAGKYLADLGSEFDAAADSIRIGTGATGEALDALMDDMESVYQSVPTTMDAASQAIADYNTRLGLTGEDLQELSVQAIQVADMLGEDLGTVIEDSSQAFQQWNIETEDMGAAMDHIFKVSQSTGIGFTDLAGNMQTYGAQLQDMGYSFEEAAALVGQLEKAGVNTEEVLGAMKKSVTTLAKEGISASEGLEVLYDMIKNAGTEAEAAAIAAEVFGTRAGSTMSAAIRDGSISVAGLTEELLANTETISGAAEDTYDFAEQLQLLKQNAEVALAPMANTVFDTLNEGMSVLQELMVELGPVFEETIEAAMPLVEEFLGGGIDMLRDFLPLVTHLGSSLLPILSQLASMILPVLLNLTDSLIEPIMYVADILLDLLSEIVLPLMEPLMELVEALLPLVGPLLVAVAKPLRTLVNVLEPLADLLGVVVGWIAKVVGWVADGLTWVVDLVFGDNLGDVADEAGVKGYATGGITNGLSIAGEDPNYPNEYIISLNPAYRSQNLSYWAEAGRMLGADTSDFSLSGESSGDYYEMGGVTFSPQITVYGHADKESIMEAIEAEYPEFMDMLDEFLDRRRATVYG